MSSKSQSPPRPPAKSAVKPTPHSEIVLLAVTGMSPAVLTETVWALAHQNPSVIPHRVIVLTTTAGRQCIEKELFAPSPEIHGDSVWNALCSSLKKLGYDLNGKLRFGTTGDDIRVFAAADPRTGRSRELEDIRTPEDNQAAADILLDEVRRITFNDDTCLIASLAGGRKTMGALLYGAMSLLGRPQDHLTHVLVREPFDDPRLCPRFYFPISKTARHYLKDRAGNVVSEHRADQACPKLADVPFVRLRKLFPKQLGRWPGRFNALVQLYSERVDQLAGPPEVRLLTDRPAIVVNGETVDVSAREYALYAFMLDRAKRNAPTNILQKHCLDELKSFLPTWAEQFAEISFQRDAAKKWKDPIDDDLRRQFSSLRAKFVAAGFKSQLASLLPARGRFGLQIRWPNQQG